MRENLLFHIKSDDYFGTLATILDLIRQDSEDKKHLPQMQNEILARLKEDLMVLQTDYRIVRKERISTLEREIVIMTTT